MNGRLTRKDYLNDLIRHCQTMCHMKCELEDFQNLRRLIAYDLQKMGEIDHEKAMKIWNAEQSRLAEKRAKKAM